MFGPFPSINTHLATGHGIVTIISIMSTLLFLYSTFISLFLQIFNLISSKSQDKIILRDGPYCLFSQHIYGKATKTNPKGLPIN
jgi:hypothetical protein